MLRSSPRVGLRGRPRGTGPFWAGLVLAVTASRADEAAAADLLVTAPQSLDGDQVYEEVVIEATVTVPPLSGSSPGWLRLFADRIVIEEGGGIDADGAGHNAGQPGPGAGTSLPEPSDPSLPTPGGGGSHIGVGTQGLWGEPTMGCPSFPAALCEPHAGADPGPIYDNPMMPAVLTDPALGMGSAGGRSWAGCPNPGTELPGGRGGGVVLLQANEIEIRGRISADGIAAPEGSATSPGGGAGGTILISASQLLSLGPTAELSAAGGDGRQGNAVGGAGGGGLIVLATNIDVSDPIATDCPAAGVACTSVAGGVTAPCTAQGAPGARVSRAPLPCPDADGDGYTNAGCPDPQSQDCNDADETINPNGEEICDGLDNDCDGSIDEQPAELCGEGSAEICVDGACQPDSGAGTGGGLAIPDPSPPRLHLGGGLCTAGAPSDGDRRLWFALLMGCAAALLRRRR